MKAISCGDCHSMALTESGRLYGWGQLEISECTAIKSPQIIEINGIFVKSISCGYIYSLMLSYDGYLYAFRDNRYIT